MSRFIDIEPYEKLGYHHLIKLNNGSVESATYTPVDEIKTVDDIPVVRCKDCIHVCDYTDIYPKSKGYKCMKNGNFHDENWYCADGVKDGEKDG